MSARPVAVPSPIADSVRWEVREEVCRQLFEVHTLNDVVRVIRNLNAAGKLTMNFGPGGIPQTMEFEQRFKVST